MADVGDDLLDGELDETTFGDLDGEEEDALLAGEDYEAYQVSQQNVYSESHDGEGRSQDNFMSVGMVQDVLEGDEILEEGEEDVLELGVVDELDESEIDNSQGNGQAWNETPQSTNNIDDTIQETSTTGVSSSTHSLTAIAGESDEEENEDRGSRFKTERTNIISLKGVTSSKSIKDIPDSLDKVKTPAVNVGIRTRGGVQRGGRGGIRGRLGPIQRGGSLAGRVGFGPRRPPPHHKIHVNPHFRGSLHQGQSGWDERLPPPPGCEGYGPPPMGNNHNNSNWGMPPPHPMARPPHPGPMHQGQQFHSPESFPPPHHQQMGFQEQFRPPIEPAPHGQPGRIVQFTENSHTITVENQNFQRPAFEQNFGPPNNFPPPQNMPPSFNNNMYPPNQFVHSPQRPTFPPQQFTPPNNVPNYQGFPPSEYHPPPNNLPPGQFQNYDNQNAWNSPLPMEGPAPQNHFYPPGPPQPTLGYCGPPQQQAIQPPQISFSNQLSILRQNSSKPIQGNKRVPVAKRLAPRMTQNSATVPLKQARFDHKPKPSPVNIRSNLQEIKTVDNLPDTTTTQEPEAVEEIEEDEEMKQYRLKIAEQKALRDKILKEKEARRKAAIIEKQKKTETNNTNLKVVTPVTTMPTSTVTTNPVVQRPAAIVRGRGRGRMSVTKVIPRNPKPVLTSSHTLSAGTPVVQIQQMLGTMYKIVKVRTKEGAIVTRKTPLVMEKPGQPAVPVKTINTAVVPQRRIVLNNPARPMGAVRGVASINRTVSNNVRMVSATHVHGRTLFSVQTTPNPRGNAPAPQRLVIDKRLPGMRFPAALPVMPVSTLVTIDNLSLSTSQQQIQKLAKQVGALCSFKHEPELKRATLKFQKPQEAEQFYLKFHRKMIDLSRISVTVVPE